VRPSRPFTGWLLLRSSRELNPLVAKKKTAKRVSQKDSASDPAQKLTEGEKDLLTHIEQGYQLETDSLGSNPVLRSLKNNEVIRPVSVNASTVKALERRSLIRPGKGRDPLTILWRLGRRTSG
jgi:hypothetical protein